MVGLSLRTLQRWQRVGGGEDGRHGPNTMPKNKLSAAEEKRLLAVLTSPEFRDLSPRQVIPALADRGEYIASEATAYRLLRAHELQHHRENTRPRRHKKPDELVADAPNQVYCWDITYLKSPISGIFYYLYLVTDIFSRRIVSAKVYDQESDELAAELFCAVQRKEGLAPDQVVLHSDNGAPMKGAILKATLERLGVLTSYSRPRTSDDNPFVESLFGTMKARVSYPKGPFHCLTESQNWVDAFVCWYNNEHRHGGLNWITPAARHSGDERGILCRRQQTYEAARKRRPERWSGRIRNCQPAGPVTLNPSAATTTLMAQAA